MKPSLGLRVPGDIERLQPSLARLDQILLERFNANSVFDLELGGLSAGAHYLYEESTVAGEEARPRTLVLEDRVIEVAQHVLPGRQAKRPAVVRPAPGGMFLLVALRARRRCDVGRALLVGRRQAGAGRRHNQAAQQNRKEVSDTGQQHQPPITASARSSRCSVTRDGRNPLETAAPRVQHAIIARLS